MQIANGDHYLLTLFFKTLVAFRVLSDPARREKYDLYGVVDEGEFRYVYIFHFLIRTLTRM